MSAVESLTRGSYGGNGRCLPEPQKEKTSFIQISLHNNTDIDRRPAAVASWLDPRLVHVGSSISTTSMVIMLTGIVPGLPGTTSPKPGLSPKRLGFW